MPEMPVYRVQLVSDTTLPIPPGYVTIPSVAALIIATYLEGQDRENFVVLMLDVKRRAIGINTVAVGSLSEAIVHPREVFKPAIIANAHSIIVGHNHPSGDPTPSKGDEFVTRMLVQAGAILGIKVLDHIIVGERVHYKSMAELRLITGYDHNSLRTKYVEAL